MKNIPLKNEKKKIKNKNLPLVRKYDQTEESYA